MTKRWTMHDEHDNAGRPFRVWRRDDYELSRNINLGNEGGWVFELVHRARAVGVYPDLSAGQEAAAQHEASRLAPARGESHSDGDAVDLGPTLASDACG